MDYGEIKPGLDDMAAIRRAAQPDQTQVPGTSVVAAESQFMGVDEALSPMLEEIEWSLDIEQHYYWNCITEDYISQMINIY